MRNCINCRLSAKLSSWPLKLTLTEELNPALNSADYEAKAEQRGWKGHAALYLSLSAGLLLYAYMDIFAHGLWTNAIYKTAQKRKRTFWELVEIFFWSNFPDFFSFGIIFVLSLFLPRYRWHGEDYYLRQAPNWLFTMHHILYSLPIFFAVWFGIRLLHGKYYWPMAGWFVHIFIDIFTHKNFFPPHFLWPFWPNVHLEWLSWSTPLFMAINYSLIILVYGFWYFYMRPKGIWETPAKPESSQSSAKPNSETNKS